MYDNSKLIIDSSITSLGKVSWRSPSNIALVKYWGKHGHQMPNNPSISFTLEEAHTWMTVEWSVKKESSKNIALKLYFDSVQFPPFETKMIQKLESLVGIFPFLYQMDLEIDTANSFPHSAGIASSASSMSALALCLCSMEHELFGTLDDDDEFERKASYVSRLLSGSACRSIYGSCAVWGEMSEVPDSSNLYAVSMEDQIHEVFRTYQNAILIVNQNEKLISSTEGHRLMEGNPYAEQRYKQAKGNMLPMLEALKTGDLERFGDLVQQEAMSLHAMMMNSNPSYILMEPETLILIRKINQFKLDTQIPLCFTLDAGPNIHLLYPEQYIDQMNSFIISELSPYCQDGMYIADHIGEGPIQL